MSNANLALANCAAAANYIPASIQRRGALLASSTLRGPVVGAANCGELTGARSRPSVPNRRR